MPRFLEDILARLPEPAALLAVFGSPYAWLFRLPSMLLVYLSGQPQKVVKGRKVDAAMHLLCARAGENPLGGEGTNPETLRQMVEENPIDLSVSPKKPVTTADHNITLSDGDEILIREYIPKNWNERTSMMYIHGGGWVLCSIDTHDSTCAYIAAALGTRVFSVNYRLAPEHPFPVPLQDCLEAWQWLMDTGCDPNDTVIAGDSAGANLATAVCIYLRDNSEPIPALQILIYPALDPTMSSQSMKSFARGFYLTRSAMKWFWQCYLPDEATREEPLAAPLLARLKNMPPAQVVVAGFDPLVDEGKQYARRLREAGVDCSVQDYPSLIHGFANMMAVPAARKAVDHFLAKTRTLLP